MIMLRLPQISKRRKIEKNLLKSFHIKFTLKVLSGDCTNLTINQIKISIGIVDKSYWKHHKDKNESTVLAFKSKSHLSSKPNS